jgi:hypothetical protein
MLVLQICACALRAPVSNAPTFVSMYDAVRGRLSYIRDSEPLRYQRKLNVRTMRACGVQVARLLFGLRQWP